MILHKSEKPGVQMFDLLNSVYSDCEVFAFKTFFFTLAITDSSSFANIQPIVNSRRAELAPQSIWVNKWTDKWTNETLEYMNEWMIG